MPRWLQWAVLALGSVMVSAGAAWTGLPAAWLLGPILVGVAVRTSGGTVAVPVPLYLVSQSLIGFLIASVISPQSLARLVSQWPLFLAIVAAIIVCLSLLSVVIGRCGWLPGTTAIWGLSPGAGAVMVVMSEAYGEDFRLVAFIQYVRVATVAVLTAVIARVWFGATDSAVHAVHWFPAIQPVAFSCTVIFALLAGIAGKILRIPGGALLVPIFLGAALQAEGVLSIQVPPWLMAASYAVLGWHVGLAFTRAAFLAALRYLPAILLSILAMSAVCFGLAWAMVAWMGVEPLTAFLATSPAGIDTALVIAASSRADIAFVTTVQVLRFMLILLVAPPLARFVVRRFATHRSAG